MVYALVIGIIFAFVAILVPTTVDNISTFMIIGNNSNV